MGRKTVIANHRGAVGKSTTARGLACAFGRMGRKVLLVDADPLSGSATYFKVRPTPSRTLDACLDRRCNVNDCIMHVSDSVDLLPSDVNLVSFEIKALNVSQREMLMQTALSDVADMYDEVIIDTPSSLGLLTTNALTLADEVIIPLRLDYFASEGLNSMMHLIADINATLNQTLELRGMLLTHVRPTLRATARNLAELNRQYAGLLLSSMITETENLAGDFERLASELVE